MELSYKMRLVIVVLGIGVAAAGGLVVKSFLKPTSFGVYGPYRADAILEEAALPIRHATNASCYACHPYEATIHKAGLHKTISCEFCHGPWADHVAGNKKIGTLPVKKGSEITTLCLRCHNTEITARPHEIIKTVAMPEHLQSQKVKLTHTCNQCHHVHAPLKYINRAKQITGLGGEIIMKTDQNKRAFLKKVLDGTIAGSLYLVFPMAGLAVVPGDSDAPAAGAPLEKLPEQVPGIRGKAYDIMDQEFAFVVDITRCIGCGSCCVADKREYNVPDGNYRTWVERYVKGASDQVYVDAPNGGLDGYQTPRTDIEEWIRDTFFVPKLCNMCREAPCVQVCPVGATFTTPDGFVLVDHERCVGCAYCIQACPYSVRYIHPETKTVDKCTWCYHRVRKGLPACVAVCPTGARKFGSLKDKNSEVYQILKGPGVLTVLKPEMGTWPALYYKGARREVV